MMLLLLSLAALVLSGRGEKQCEIEEMSLMLVEVNLDHEWQPEYYRKSLREAHQATGKWDCTHFNKENLRYSLKVRHNGTIKDVEIIGCRFDADNKRTYYYIAKGEFIPTSFQLFGENVLLFCGVPMNRACENPTDYGVCHHYSSCPKFTQGSDREAAKLECPGSKWRVRDTNYQLAQNAKCKGAKPEGTSWAKHRLMFDGTEARFFLTLPSGEEIKVDSKTTCARDNVGYSGSKDSDSGSYSSSGVYLPILVAILVLLGLFVGVYYCRKQRNRPTQYAQYPQNDMSPGPYPTVPYANPQTAPVPYPAAPYASQEMAPAQYPTVPYASQETAPVPYPTVPYAGHDPTQRDTVAVEPAESSEKAQ